MTKRFNTLRQEMSLSARKAAAKKAQLLLEAFYCEASHEVDEAFDATSSDGIGAESLFDTPD